jgi:pimeloyl-ACP methyl ester carboxylesterase
MLSKTARLATRSMRYLEAGSGRPLVLLHGFPLGADQWLPQLSRVPAGWRFVAPDLPGFGGSTLGAGPEGVTMDTYAADVFELMAHLDMPRAAVAGLSMGGYVALAMLRRAPARVTALVLADTRATADTPEGRAGRDAMVALLQRDGAAGVAEQMLPALLGATTKRQQPDLADAVRRLIEGHSPEGLAAAVRAMKARPDSTADLASIRCPALVLCGAEDTITPPAVCEALHRAIAGSRFAVIP